MRIRSSSSDRKKRDAPGIALPAGAAAQLVVDAPALVAFRADHEQPARLLHLLMRRGDLLADLRLARGVQSRIVDPVQFLLQPHLEVAAEFDVGAAAGHVGGDGHRARRAGLRHDLGLLLVEARVQHRVRHPLLLQQIR